PLVPPQGLPQRMPSCLEYLQHDRAKAFQTWYVFAWLFAQVVTLAQGHGPSPADMCLERHNLGATHPTPLHQEAALRRVAHAMPVGVIDGAEPTLGEHMEPDGLNHLGREKGREPLRAHFLMLQVPTEPVVCPLGFMDQ